MVDVCEWVVNEQCGQYDECELYQPFVGAEKPVLRIEYTKKEPAPKAFKEKMCGMQGSEGFSTLIKHMALNAWTEVCPFEQPRDNGKRDAENGAVSRRGLLHAPKWWRGVNRARGQEV